MIIPSYDSGRPPAKPEMRLYPPDFLPPAHVYQNRVYLEKGEIRTKLIDIPSTATELFLYGRAVPESDVFPRLKISLVNDNSSNTLSIPVFTGAFRSRPSDYLRCSIPESARGKQAQILIESLNYSALNDRRKLILWFIGLR